MTDLADCVIVIPSNRVVSADRLHAIPDGVAVLVVGDGEHPVRCDRRGAQSFDLAFQRRFMGADFDLIPRGTAACRNFGFYYVWRETDYRFIVTLDDDVAVRQGFLDAYELLDESRELPAAIECRWLNTIDLFDGAPRCFARGFPYELRSDAAHQLTTAGGRVVCHMGLWDGALDTNAIDRHLLPACGVRHEPLQARRAATRVGAPGARVMAPLSAMNVGFVRELLPCMYQWPMRWNFTRDYSLWRHDDIWAGYVAQTLMAIRQEAFTVGAPVVRHDKNGDLERELRGEHYGLLLSPFLYAVVDMAAATIKPGPYVHMLADLAEAILIGAPRLQSEARVPRFYWSYIAEVMRILQRWVVLCLSCARG